jgi:TonB family protein
MNSGVLISFIKKYLLKFEYCNIAGIGYFAFVYQNNKVIEGLSFSKKGAYILLFEPLFSSPSALPLISYIEAAGYDEYEITKAMYALRDEIDNSILTKGYYVFNSLGIFTVDDQGVLKFQSYSFLKKDFSVACVITTEAVAQDHTKNTPSKGKEITSNTTLQTTATKKQETTSLKYIVLVVFLFMLAAIAIVALVLKWQRKSARISYGAILPVVLSSSIYPSTSPPLVIAPMKDSVLPEIIIYYPTKNKIINQDTGKHAVTEEVSIKASVSKGFSNESDSPRLTTNANAIHKVEAIAAPAITKLVKEPDARILTNPVFTGSSLEQYIQRNIKYPPAADNFDVEGRVVVQVIIQEDGLVKNARIVQGISSDFDKEAIRLVKKMPRWLPGTQAGKPVPVEVLIPINFKNQ